MPRNQAVLAVNKRKVSTILPKNNPSQLAGLAISANKPDIVTTAGEADRK